MPIFDKPDASEQNEDSTFGRTRWQDFSPAERKALIAAYGGGVGGAIVVPRALGQLSWHLGQKPKLTGAQEKTLRKAMHAKSVQTDVNPAMKALRNAFATVRQHLSPKGKKITRPVVVSGEPLGASILAHEFGHLTGPWRKFFMKMRAATPATGLAALIGAPLAGNALGRPEDSVGKTALKGGLAGGGIGLAGSAPLWLEELRASLRGLRGLGQTTLSGKKLGRAAGGLAAALGTYAAPGLLLGAGTGIIGALARRARARKKQEEQR